MLITLYALLKSGAPGRVILPGCNKAGNMEQAGRACCSRPADIELGMIIMTTIGDVSGLAEGVCCRETTETIYAMTMVCTGYR